MTFNKVCALWLCLAILGANVPPDCGVTAAKIVEALERRTNEPTSVGMKSSSKPCAKVDFFVNITSIIENKWAHPFLKSIIAPKVINIFSCDGTCSNSKTTIRHVLVNQILHQRAGFQRNIGSPSCIPTKLAPMRILQLDNNNNVVLSKFDDAIVKECGCRGDNNVKTCV